MEEGTLVNTVMNILVPKYEGDFLPNSASISSERIYDIYGISQFVKS
jgi:hypothetical protein